jgi:HEAT repeat protein
MWLEQSATQLFRCALRCASNFGSRMAARALPAALEPAPLPPQVLSGEAIEALCAQLVASTSWQARVSAAVSLSQVTADDVVPTLVRALRDPSVEVAVAAIQALANRNTDDATRELLAVLENRDGWFSPVTRVAVISALARKLDGEHFEPVFAALRDIDAEVSIAATAVIAERVPSRAGALLLPILRDTSGYYLPVVRLAVANALERTGALHAGVVAELASREADQAVLRVLERAQYLAEPLTAE